MEAAESPQQNESSLSLPSFPSTESVAESSTHAQDISLDFQKSEPSYESSLTMSNTSLASIKTHPPFSSLTLDESVVEKKEETFSPSILSLQNDLKEYGQESSDTKAISTSLSAPTLPEPTSKTSLSAKEVEQSSHHQDPTDFISQKAQNFQRWGPKDLSLSSQEGYTSENLLSSMNLEPYPDILEKDKAQQAQEQNLNPQKTSPFFLGHSLSTPPGTPQATKEGVNFSALSPIAVSQAPSFSSMANSVFHFFQSKLTAPFQKNSHQEHLSVSQNIFPKVEVSSFNALANDAPLKDMAPSSPPSPLNALEKKQENALKTSPLFSAPVSQDPSSQKKRGKKAGAKIGKVTSWGVFSQTNPKGPGAAPSDHSKKEQSPPQAAKETIKTHAISYKNPPNQDFFAQEKKESPPSRSLVSHSFLVMTKPLQELGSFVQNKLLTPKKEGPNVLREHDTQKNGSPNHKGSSSQKAIPEGAQQKKTEQRARDLQDIQTPQKEALQRGEISFYPSSFFLKVGNQRSRPEAPARLFKNKATPLTTPKKNKLFSMLGKIFPFFS